MSQALVPAQVVADEREWGWLLSKAGARVTWENLAALKAQVSRARRARWLGAAGAMVAGAEGWLGDSFSPGLGVAWLLTGYLIGATTAAFQIGGPPVRRSGQAADVGRRIPGRPAGPLARWLPWVTLAPCLAAPLLLLGDHPQGIVRIHRPAGFAMATSSWFSPGLLITTAAIALGALLLWEVQLAVLGRGRPVDDPGTAAVDRVARVLCARSAGAASAALGLCLISGLATASGDPLESRTCSTLRDCHFVYPWHVHVQALQGLGFLLMFLAIVVYLVGRCRWTPAGRVLAAGAATEPDAPGTAGRGR